MRSRTLWKTAGYGMLFLCLSSFQAVSGEAASVSIFTPVDGAEIDAGQPFTLKYQVSPGPKGDHVHLYINGTEVAILRKLEGSYRIAPLSEGRYELSVKVVNRAHVPIGVEASVNIDVL